jgi:hypothetical protein
MYAHIKIGLKTKIQTKTKPQDKNVFKHFLDIPSYGRDLE